MPLKFKQVQPDRKREIVVCEICGQQLLRDYAYSFLVQLCATGHAYIPMLRCDAQGHQHWGCSYDHAVKAAIVCLKEHIAKSHKELWKQHALAGHPFASSEDEHLLEEKGEFFYYGGNIYEV